MSESKMNRKDPSAAKTPDPIDQLKAYIENSAVEPSVSPAEEDDLAALLRAQLAASAPPSNVHLDLSGFEPEETIAPVVEEPAPVSEETAPTAEALASVDEERASPVATVDSLLNQASPSIDALARLDRANTVLLCELGLLTTAHVPPEPVPSLSNRPTPAAPFVAPEKADAVPTPRASGAPSSASEAMSDAERGGTPPAADETAPVTPPVGSAVTFTAADFAALCDPLQPDFDAPHETGGTGSATGRTTADACPADLASTSGYAAVTDLTGTEAGEARDTAFYLGLGYANDLRRAEEQARIERVRTATADASTAPDGMPVEGAAEGTTHAPETADPTAAPSRQKPGAALPVAWMAFGTFLCLLYQYLPLLFSLLSLEFPPAEAPAYPAVGMGLALLWSLPAMPRLAQGLWSGVTLHPTRYTLPAIAYVAAIGGGICSLLLPSAAAIPSYFGVAMLYMTGTWLSDYAEARQREQMTSVTSCGKAFFAFTEDETPPAAALRRTRPDAPRSGADRALRTATQPRTVLTAVETDRVLASPKETASVSPLDRLVAYVLPIALLIALLATGLCVAQGGRSPSAAGDQNASLIRLSTAVETFIRTLLLCLPAVLLPAESLSLYRANRRLARRGCAVLGHPVGRPETVIFRDGDAFVAMHRREITLRGDDPAETVRARSLCNRLLAKLESPLAVDDPLLSAEHAEADGISVEIAENSPGFARYYLVDDRDPTHPAVELLMGTHDALTRRGVRLPKVAMERTYKLSPDSHVVYVAFDRTFHLAYAVEYGLNPRFMQMVQDLDRLHCAWAISTYDPMVTPLLMERLLCTLPTPRDGNVAPPPVLLRPDYPERRHTARAARLIATERGTDLGYALLADTALYRAYAALHIVLWGGVALTGLLSLILAITQATGALISALPLLWTVLSALVIYFPLAIVRQMRMRPSGERRAATAAPATSEPPAL